MPPNGRAEATPYVVSDAGMGETDRRCRASPCVAQVGEASCYHSVLITATGGRMRLVPLALLFLYSAAAIAEGSVLVRRGEQLVLATGGPAVSVPFRIETVREDVAGELSLRSRDSGATWNVALTAA